MKKLFVLLLLSAVLLIIVPLTAAYLPQTLGNPEPAMEAKNNESANPADEQSHKNTGVTSPDPEKILNMVKPSIVTAAVTKETSVYSSYSSNQVVGQLAADEKVEIIKDKGYKWYYVRNDEITGWVPAGALSIPPDPATNRDKMTREEVETYINLQDFKSYTDYLVWVDIDRQLTHVFTGSEDNWELLKTMTCATGKNVSPTLRGTFTIKDRGTWFYSPQFESGAKYWVRYNGSYLFHSVAMDKQQQVKDPTLGKRASSGCIRLAVEDAKWFYDNIPKGTTVFIN
ncbi:MAG: L,D-transpeptidase family protein [Desulfotomaculum sp.]|nr:L,D-transpeptidase family protein [Desulfotomaculum sp.]